MRRKLLLIMRQEDDFCISPELLLSLHHRLNGVTLMTHPCEGIKLNNARVGELLCNHFGGGWSGGTHIRSWSVMPSGPGALLGRVTFCANNNSVCFLFTML